MRWRCTLSLLGIRPCAGGGNAGVESHPATGSRGKARKWVPGPRVTQQQERSAVEVRGVKLRADGGAWVVSDQEAGVLADSEQCTWPDPGGNAGRLGA